VTGDPKAGQARAGYAAAAAAAVLWATGGAAARHVIDAGASLRELTEARSWIAAAVLCAFVWLRRDSERPRERSSPLLAVVFGTSIAAANFTYYAALARLPIAIAITVQYTAPALVVIWTVGAERSWPPGRVVAALASAVAGVALLVELPMVARGRHVGLSAAGVGYAVASAFAFATYMLTGERLGRRVGARRAVAQGFAVAATLWILVQATRGLPRTIFEPRFVPWVIFLGVATTIVPFFLFVWGLERVRASRARSE